MCMTVYHTYRSEAKSPLLSAIAPTRDIGASRPAQHIGFDNPPSRVAGFSALTEGDISMRSYEAARRYFSFIEFICKSVILVGFLILLGAVLAISEVDAGVRMLVSPAAILVGFPFGAWVVFTGFMGLVRVQDARASVDAAEYAQQGLKISREQLEISRQALKQGAPASAGYVALQAAKAELVGGQPEQVSDAAASYADHVPSSDESAAADEALEIEVVSDTETTASEPRESTTIEHLAATGTQRIELDHPVPDQVAAETRVSEHNDANADPIEAPILEPDDPLPEEPYDGPWRIEEKYGHFYAKGQVFPSRAAAIAFLQQDTAG